MQTTRAQFSSRFGFLMAAAGAAVGLGNVWSFPSMAANNGGGAFLLIYLVMAFILAYPALMAELMLGRYAQSGIIKAMGGLTGNAVASRSGMGVGLVAIGIATLGLTFYAIVTGWLVQHTLQPLAEVSGAENVAAWLREEGTWRDWWFALAAMAATVVVVLAGVNEGIERWSKRLMPLLILTMVVLIGIIMTFPGALEGLRAYLVPDFAHVDAGLMLDAMGQAFFSLSIGIGAMVVYGSYLSRNANLPRTGAQVLFIDMGVAFIAGLLIIPAMYVARAAGIDVLDGSGELASSAKLLFVIMPTMFEKLGGLGVLMETLFFGLLAVAALTSMFPALEVPVSTLEEAGLMSRKRSTLLVGAVAFGGSTLILLNFDWLFGLVINSTIKSMPVIGALECFYIGWLLSRNAKLKELRQGAPEIEQTLFWKLWPWYIRFVCPLLPLLVLFNGLGG